MKTQRSCISLGAFLVLTFVLAGGAFAQAPPADDSSADKAAAGGSDDGEQASNGDDTAPAKAGMGEAIVVNYTGKLQDQNGDPISGVFELSFHLYKSKDAANPAWQERRYVAVEDGSYMIGLGETRPLERRHIPEKPWIGINLVGEGEILRDKLDVSDLKLTDEEAREVVSAETKKLLEIASEGSSIAFADVAQRAVKADQAKRAEQADKLGEMTAQEIKDLSNLALERLGSHIADPKAHEAAGGIRLGSGRQVTDSAGGSGGSSYQLNCPAGYVVVGIRGGAGRLIDSISLICKPLR